jgi:hypothetical protein
VGVFARAGLPTKPFSLSPTFLLPRFGPYHSDDLFSKKQVFVNGQAASPGPDAALPASASAAASTQLSTLPNLLDATINAVPRSQPMRDLQLLLDEQSLVHKFSRRDQCQLTFGAWRGLEKPFRILFFPAEKPGEREAKFRYGTMAEDPRYEFSDRANALKATKWLRGRIRACKQKFRFRPGHQVGDDDEEEQQEFDEEGEEEEDEAKEDEGGEVEGEDKNDAEMRPAQ